MTSLDRGYLLVAVIAFVAIWPFLSRASLPSQTDAELHVFRLVELSGLIRGGEFYPRWAPNFYHGYGYPIFNYYAPLSYYAALVFELLPRVGPVTAVKIIFVLSLLGGALGIYGFARDRWGRAAGYVGAALFVYSPYIQYIDPHARGVLAESFSLGLFPLALWALDRLQRQATPWRWVSAVGLMAAVILSHNLMALALFGLATGWAVWQMWVADTAADRQQTWRLFVALGLGVGMAAFFWLPVALERNAVNLNTLLGEGDNYDFRTHFLTLSALLAPTLRLDWSAAQPLFRFNLGVAQWLLAALAAGWLVWRRPQGGRRIAFFGVAALLLIFLMLPSSQWVWEIVPLLPYFQFPWRLLGPAAMMLALLTGAGVADFLACLRPSRRGLAAATAVSLPLLLGLPLSQPAPWEDFGPATTPAMTAVEQRGRWLGTTSTADYVPVTVEAIPERKGQLVVPLATGEMIDRVNRAGLPEQTEVVVEPVRPLLTRYYTDSQRPFRLRLFQFDFPGWRATIDGEPAETELGTPEGFLVVLVPAGQHVVEVAFGTTPPRTAGWLIAAVSLLALGGLAWRARGDASREDRQNKTLTAVDGWVLGTVVAVTAVSLLIFEPAGWLRLESEGYEVLPAQENVFVDFGEQIALVGYDLSAQTVQPGETLTLALYWKAQQPLDINYQGFVHLLRPDGSLIAPQSDKLNPGEFPTRRWPLDKYVRDVHKLSLPADFPPGDYTVSVGLWVQQEGWRLPVLNTNGEQTRDAYPLQTIRVEP